MLGQVQREEGQDDQDQVREVEVQGVHEVAAVLLLYFEKVVFFWRLFHVREVLLYPILFPTDNLWNGAEVHQFPFLILKILYTLKHFQGNITILSSMIIVDPQIINVNKEPENWFEHFTGGWNLVQHLQKRVEEQLTEPCQVSWVWREIVDEGLIVECAVVQYDDIDRVCEVVNGNYLDI